MSVRVKRARFAASESEKFAGPRSKTSEREFFMNVFVEPGETLRVSLAVRTGAPRP
jgi:hypothetical protein